MRQFFDGTGKNVFGGIKLILPLIVIYSILMLLGTLYWSFFHVLAEITFDMLIALLTIVIAFKVSGKTTLLSGAIIGVRVAISSLGFFGAIFMALLVGFLTKLLLILFRRIKKHSSYSMLLCYIIIPGIVLLISFVSLNLFVYPVIQGFLDVLNSTLITLSSGNIVLLAGALGCMTAFDLGGPVNKIAYTFALSAFLEGHYMISSPLLIASTIPPLGLGVSAYLLHQRFTTEELDARNQTLFFSAFGLTEGALAYVTKHPIPVMGSVIVGSTVAAAISAYFGLENQLLASSVLGVFGTSNIPLYFLSHFVGVGVVIMGIFLFKRKECK